MAATDVPELAIRRRPPAGPEAAPGGGLSGSPASLRLLVGFLLTADEAAPVRERVLAPRPGRARAGCGALTRLVAATVASAEARAAVDRWLAAVLERRARAFRGTSARRLTRLWRAGGASLCGPDLAALLWCAARGPGPDFRRLESAIAAACEPERLLSDAQRRLAAADARPRSPEPLAARPPAEARDHPR